MAVSRWNYKLIYPEYAGGVLALPRQTLQQINGYSNRFYGWGGEDDDLWARLERHNVRYLILIMGLNNFLTKFNFGFFNFQHSCELVV